MFQDYVYQNKEKENREAELTIINKELAFQNHEKEKRIFALITANSELKKAEKELAEKEFFLRESQKIGKIGSYELNFITGFWKSSEMLDSIFGINQNYDRSILGWIEIIHPHDQQKMDEYLRMEVIVKQKSFNKEYRIIRINDRQTRWVHGRGELKFDTTGNITEMIGTIQDITERKKTEENLKQSENRFRSFYEKACDPILIIDESFHFTDCNNAAIAILGATSKDQIINKPPVFFSPEYQPDGQLSAVKAEQMIKNAYKEGSHQFEWIHKRIDGFAIYIDVRLTVIPMENKNVLLVYWRDITESKKAEATIRKLYQAIEHTNEIVFMTDIDGTLNFVNTAFEEVYGYKKEEVVGKTTPRILKSGIMEKQFYEELWKKLPSGKGLSKEIVNKTKDGRLINIHTSLTPIFDDRKILIGYMAVQEDITEKKIAEKKLLNAELKYRTLFEQSSDGISVVDPETLLPIDFNEKMHTQLGYSREEFAQLKISDYEMIFSPEIIKEREIKIKLHGHANFETTHKKKNGDILHVQVDIISIILHGKPQFYATYRDITEKIKLERERKQHEIDQQRQIVEATISGQEAEKKDLSLELHDNIVQILVTVKIYLGILKSKENIPEVRGLADQSYDYLNIAMEELRKLSHSLSAPSLCSKGLDEALHDLLEEINATRNFKVNLMCEIGEIRTIDEKKSLMLYRITQEQINNINKHAHAKNVIVHLKEKDAQLELSITDDGVGFDTSKKNMGIGLKNIQSRVEFYSGKMNIISSPGQGCRIELTIPL